jgi:hypothetical protein
MGRRDAGTQGRVADGSSRTPCGAALMRRPTCRWSDSPRAKSHPRTPNSLPACRRSRPGPLGGNPTSGKNPEMMRLIKGQSVVPGVRLGSIPYTLRARPV